MHSVVMQKSLQVFENGRHAFHYDRKRFSNMVLSFLDSQRYSPGKPDRVLLFRAKKSLKGLVRVFLHSSSPGLA